MQGYWGFDMHTCRCCRSGPKQKFWCPRCDHVTKGTYDGAPSCPHGHGLMTAMGHRWRPGPKRNRSRQGHPPVTRVPWMTPAEWAAHRRELNRSVSPGELLLAKIMSGRRGRR